MPEESASAAAHSANSNRQSPNAADARDCHKYQRPLLRLFLRVVGPGASDFAPGELLAGRYRVIAGAVVLDTQPAQPPDFPDRVPEALLPYSRLSPYQLHVPQVFGRVSDRDLWLLEYGYLRSDRAAGLERGEVLPMLTDAWAGTSPLRQLHWLWQMARLWQPLSDQGVAGALLDAKLVRVDGSLVHLLELPLDPEPESMSLAQLGLLWTPWTEGASPAIRDFFSFVCVQLTAGAIARPEQLVAVLDRALQRCGSSQQRLFQLAARTDVGPMRDHNEDALHIGEDGLAAADALAIVCDGVGGHAEGEVASRLAVDVMLRKLSELPQAIAPQEPEAISLELAEILRETNDAIGERNDRERRQGRQRMGTTLVMAMARSHELYVAHVGDSRAYWITRRGCQQLTLDDDVASQQTRLGQTLYREALQQPAAGSLVQVLGTGPSALLHPNIQRVVLDEDGLFLLCSDGLSDFDRVEQYWEQELLPVLEEQTTLQEAAERLLTIANTQNGHDNVTVALLYCQVSRLGGSDDTALLGPWESWVSSVLRATNLERPSPLRQRQSTPTVRAATPRAAIALSLAIVAVAIASAIGLSYAFVPEARAAIDGVRQRLLGSPLRDPSDFRR
ncbi:serine/threonine protein phosphatase [Rubidibacter lacunae KORDI 51-2]|uniref:Serine/threonine protein phosphatase n=1 Tax=Rubidibacter lacunae KORDI 51-2 TaxID=582515 RepID=U5DLF8_9CHRO|nr:serine/threonine protein phosphatase [Rubidibacter lacunae KORDI 51-2]